MKKVTTMVVPVAGIGSRLRPITNATTKELVRLVDRPIYYYLMDEASLAGIERVIFIVHQERPQLRTYIEGPHSMRFHETYPNMRFHFIEVNERHGDGHALIQARKMVEQNEAFAVSMGDLIAAPGTSLLGELVKVYEKNAQAVISVEKIDRKMTEQYGVIAPTQSKGRLHTVGNIVEKPKPKVAPSNLIMTGKYILTPTIFEYIEKLLESHTSGEIKLAHALSLYASEHPLQAYECKARHYDTGTMVDLLKTELQYALKHPTYGAELRKFLRKKR